nr:hypothetical protein Sh253G12g_380 [Saccharum hybrid cultivar R570]
MLNACLTFSWPNKVPFDREASDIFQAELNSDWQTGVEGGKTGTRRVSPRCVLAVVRSLGSAVYDCYPATFTWKVSLAEYFLVLRALFPLLLQMVRCTTAIASTVCIRRWVTTRTKGNGHSEPNSGGGRAEEAWGGDQRRLFLVLPESPQEEEQTTVSSRCLLIWTKRKQLRAICCVEKRNGSAIAPLSVDEKGGGKWHPAWKRGRS